MKKRLFFACLAFSIVSLGASCPGPTGQTDPVYNPKPTPPTPTDTEDCPAACKAMQDHHCKEGDDLVLPDGKRVSCADWCQYEQEQNHVELNPSCVKTITNCDEIETRCAVGRTR